MTVKERSNRIKGILKALGRKHSLEEFLIAQDLTYLNVSELKDREGNILVNEALRLELESNFNAGLADILKSSDESFKYMLLDRMRQDIEYYFNYGEKSEDCLWAKDFGNQIKYMLGLYDHFPEDKKPVYLTREQILEYKRRNGEQNGV